MSDELPKKVLSVPPPPTDEIDDEWGNKGSDAKAPKTATAAAEAGEAVKTKPTSDAAAKKLHAETANAAETATPPGTPEASIVDEEDEEEDEDDEEEEDEDEEEAHESVHSAAPVTRTSRPSVAAAEEWLPDWAPWAVLGAIIVVGLLGGVGAFNKKGDAQADDKATTTTATTAAATKPGGAAVLDANASIEASHFLVQYQGSMRAAPTITRTKDEAKKRAEEGLAKIKKGEDFAKVVADYSDEPGAGARGGKLGEFTRDRMIKPFSDAAFALKVNEVSGVVETPFGFHVIKRTK